jgi:hypothetical protein
VGVEVDFGLDAQNQNRVARDSQLERFAEVSPDVDCAVGASGDTRPTPNARLLHNLDVRLLHPYRLYRTSPDTGQTGDTLVRVDFELHAFFWLAERRSLELQGSSNHAAGQGECQWRKSFSTQRVMVTYSHSRLVHFVPVGGQ